MSRKIVFINQATGYLTIDVLNEFVNDFDEVALITGSIRIQNTPLNPKVKVSKITKYSRGNIFRKALSWIIGTIQISFLLRFKFKDFERLFYTIPPTAYLFISRYTNLTSIVVFDLYPEALKIYGFREEGILYRWWTERNKRIFSNAHRVYTLSNIVKLKIVNSSNEDIVREIPNWSAFSGVTPVKKEHNSIVQKGGFDNKFIVQYSGNIGVTHKVEILVELADLLKNHLDIVFQIIGRGERRRVIESLIESKKLANCMLLPFRKDEELYESLCASDIAVVTLDDKVPDISVPSKVYNIMAAGVPILAIASLSSSTSRIVIQHDIGDAFEKENLNGMAEYILRVKNDPVLLKKLAANSFKASKYYSSSNAKKYLEFYKDEVIE